MTCPNNPCLHFAGREIWTCATIESFLGINLPASKLCKQDLLSDRQIGTNETIESFLVLNPRDYLTGSRSHLKIVLNDRQSSFCN